MNLPDFTKCFTSLVALTLSAGQSDAAIKTWDAGGGDLLWSTGANWNTDGLPAATDSIVFASSFSSGTAINLNGNRTINDLSISSPTNFSLNNNVLTITNGSILRTATTGTTTINSGIAMGTSGTWSNAGGLLQVTGGIIGSNTDITFTGSGAFTMNGIIATTSGKINATGTGLLTLTGANTYTDTTSIASGSVINIQNNTALGTTGGDTIISSGGALQIQGGIAVGNEDLSLNGSGISGTGALRNISGNNSWAGQITLANVATVHRINSDAGTLTLGDIREAGSLDGKNLTLGGAGNIIVNGNITAGGGDMLVTKDGTGTVTLNGTNTYRGGTTLREGVLSVTTINNGGSSGGLGRATSAATNLIFDGGTLRYTGATASTNRNFTINTGKVATIEVTTNTLTLTGASVATNSSLVKSGLGTLTLTGNNLNTGDTVIKAGTLTLSGSGDVASTNIIVGDAGSSGAVLNATAKTGGLTIASGESISGIGTIQATTTIQGTIRPGNSGAGILSHTGNITLQSSSNLAIDLNGAAAGTQYDQLNLTGSATLAGLLNVTVTYTPALNSLFFILINDGADPISGIFSNAPLNGGTYTFGGQQFQVSYFGNSATNSFTGGNDVVLRAIPEASSLLLAGLGGLLLFRRRRDF